MNPWSRERGQVLAMLAVFMVVLMAAVALAVDFGNVYAERRRMQNAADAGALAGARELCFGSGETGPAESVAEQYATTGNGAQEAQISILQYEGEGGVVTVTTQITANTYLAGIVGLSSVNVPAVAAAACGKARSAGGLWPLTLKMDEYRQMPCDQLFYVFTDDSDVDCTECFCDVHIPGVGRPTKIGPGQRGWLRFFQPPEHSDPCAGDSGNCGDDALDCWVREDHPGPVSICDRIPGQPGVNSRTWRTAGEREPDIVNIPLWDLDCGGPTGPTLGTCPGTSYLVAGFGCIEIVGSYTVDFPSREPPPPMCRRNVKIIVVRRHCDCESFSGSTGGDPPDPDEVRAVSLIR